jgi:Holliday junction resolvase RusA-like endonuclease
MTLTQERLRYWVAGEPIPQGSKRVWLGADKQVRMREDAGVRHTTWRWELATAARQAMSAAGLTEPYWQPVYVSLHFALHRPSSHYGTGRNLKAVKPSAPDYPAKVPDIDKLTRAVLDSMTSIVWVDDAQVVRLHATKGFVHRWEEEGVSILMATYDKETEVDGE